MRYVWQNKKTNKEIEVNRKMADSDIPPTNEEMKEEGWDDKEIKEAELSKVISGGLGHVGFGQKGNW